MGKQARHVTARKPAPPSSASPAATTSASATGSTARAKICNGGAPKAPTRSRRSGPSSPTGADYGNLQLTTRLNGEVVQQQYTSDLIFDCAADRELDQRMGDADIAGDVIYTGTPGSTRKMSPGDVVQVELSGVGVLENPVA